MPGIHLSRRAAVGLAIVVAIICAFASARMPLMRTVETRLVDMRLRGPHDAPPVDGLLIVGIEEATLSGDLERFGPAALARAEYAPVIANLHKHGAAVVVIDVFFGDAPEQAAGTAKLARAMQDAGNVLLVAYANPELHEGGERVEFGLPTEALAEQAAGIVSPLLFRPDNIVRWVIPWQRAGENTVYPAMALAIAQRMSKSALATSTQPLMINWAGPAGTVPRVRFEDVYADRVSADQIKGRAALIGVTHEEEDLFATPVLPMSGVEAHANAAATMISGKLIPPQSDALGLLLALVVAVIIALAGTGRSHWQVWAIAGALLIVWLPTAMLVFRTQLVMLPMTPVTLTIVAWGVLLSALQSQRAIASLSRLWPSWVKEEGEQLEVTVLVCDIAGYTARSEETSAREMMDLMREVFAIVDQVVEPLGGVAARRPGDAALVFFRPNEGATHYAARAVQAAMDLRDRLAEALQGRDLGFGITLTTGEVSLGWVGESPPEPQILGDPVNVAFRLQSECRERDCLIIADWATASADPETSAAMRPLGQVEVRNRREPVQIFAPVESD
jgi:CHASE2 domain-containing sensor protein